MAKYKAYLSGLTQEQKNGLKQASCYLLISVGGKDHEAGRLQAVVNQIEKNFKSCVVLVADTLQRHNFITDIINEKEAYNIALEAGDNWLARNINTIKDMNIAWRISRWDEWINHSNYELCRKKIELEYNNENSEFKKAILNTTENFLIRYSNRNKKLQISLNAFKNNSINYLKEECAAMILWAMAGLNYEIYPSHRVEAMQATQKLFIDNNYPGTLQPITFNCKKVVLSDP